MAITRKEKDTDKVTMIVANSKITIGNKYTLDHKYDAKAPSVLQQIGATKYPFEGNNNMECIIFDEVTNRYDTGFDESSPCLQVLKDKELIKDQLIYYNKYIKAPYEKQFGADLNPLPTNDFWRDYKIEAYVNKQFDTSKVRDLMELFHLLYMGAVCEKDEREPSLRVNAKFTLSSSSEIKNKTKIKTQKLQSTVILLSSMVMGDRDKLNLILQWIGKDDVSKMSDEDVMSIHYQIINGEDGVAFCDKFKLAYDEYETETGKEKMEWFYSIKRLVDKRKIKKTNRGYVSNEDVFLGNSLQDISTFCLTDGSPQRDIVMSLIEANPTVKRHVKPEHLK